MIASLVAAAGTQQYFFDHLLPIKGQTSNATRVGLGLHPRGWRLQRRETQTFLYKTLFYGTGSWTQALTADHSYMNRKLAEFLTALTVSKVVPTIFRETISERVDLNTTQRRGFLTQAGVMTGVVAANETNPVTQVAVRNVLLSGHPGPTPSWPP